MSSKYEDKLNDVIRNLSSMIVHKNDSCFENWGKGICEQEERKRTLQESKSFQDEQNKETLIIAKSKNRLQMQ